MIEHTDTTETATENGDGGRAVPNISLAELIERGRATRFAPGNQAAKGRGRPPKPYSSKRLRWSEQALRELRRVAFDATHPWHDRHGYDALVALAKICTPKMREHTGRDGEKLTVVDVHALIFGEGQGDDDEVG